MSESGTTLSEKEVGLTGNMKSIQMAEPASCHSQEGCAPRSEIPNVNKRPKNTGVLFDAQWNPGKLSPDWVCHEEQSFLNSLYTFVAKTGEVVNLGDVPREYSDIRNLSDSDE